MSHTDVGRAVVSGAQDEVFAALVDAEARSVCLPPAGMSGRFEWFDARPGGGYRLVLSYDDPAVPGKSDGNTDVVEVRFVDVAAPHRIVEEADFVSDDEAFAGTMTMTWSLEPAGSGTLVTITATDVPDGISGADHVAAFTSTLANLDTHCAHAAIAERLWGRLSRPVRSGARCRAGARPSTRRPPGGRSASPAACSCSVRR